jgi:hypothetical protein
MQSMQTCPHVGTNVQKLLQAVDVDNERQLMSDGGNSVAEQALVYRAIRDAIDGWKSTSPEITKIDRQWPRDFTKKEQTELRKLKRGTMLKVSELWKSVMEGGKLNEAIKALSKEILKEKAVLRGIL